MLQDYDQKLALERNFRKAELFSHDTNPLLLSSIEFAFLGGISRINVATNEDITNRIYRA